MNIEKISVIGAGTMGNGIAQVAATSGYQVTLMDVATEILEKAKQSIDKSANELFEKGIINQKSPTEAIKTVVLINDVSDADLIIEAASEDLELKMRILRDLNQIIKKETIVSSNTSSISITKIASAYNYPEKVIGMHFMNPVPLMRLVEVIRGLATSDETTSATMQICQQMGKEPVEANDSPGFISNRVLCPMINEAIFALQEGIGLKRSIV